jgi:hypothetical protein
MIDQTCLLLVLIATMISLVSSQKVEEFHISSPMDLHSLAMETFMQYRRDVDPKANLDTNSPLMRIAHDYAVNRFITKHEREIRLRDTETGEVDSSGNPVLLQLSAPDSDSVLASAVTSRVRGRVRVRIRVRGRGRVIVRDRVRVRVIVRDLVSVWVRVSGFILSLSLSLRPLVIA